ncbi:MAG: sulfatase [Pseudomonadota bacterium]
MRLLPQTLLTLLACGLCSCAIADPVIDSETSEDLSRPNIIVIMADDLGWGDIGLNGADLINTPNIDRIGLEGVQLSSFYAGANVCTPSRAALLTGRYPIRSSMQHVVHPHSQFGLPQSEITIAEVLKDAGYATAMIGKWHLGHSDEFWPTAHGFESFYGVAYSNDMQPFDLFDGKTVIESPVDQTALTENYAEQAVLFIQEHQEEPFFLYYAETFPHIPLFVPDRATGQSEAGHYGDVVEHLDWGIGRILEALDETGLADNTLILVTSDNGPWFEGDSGPYRDRKGETYEGGYRVPFLARWPARIDPGVESSAMTMSIDLLPTLAGIAGATVPSDRPIDGRNILSVMQGSDDTPHEQLYFFNGNDVAAVRNEQFKLVLNAYYKSFYVPFEQFGGVLLFDLEKDPQERFSYVREHPDIVADLKSRVDQMRSEIAGKVFEPISPFAPRSPDAPIGPQLTPESE